MKEILYHGIPIDGRMPLFNAEMRQAVRDDRKGQTRRPIDPQLKKWSFQNGSLFYSFEKAHKGVKASSVGPFGNEEQAWRYFINKHCPWTVGDVRCMREPLMRGATTGVAYYLDDYRSHRPATAVISLITGKPIPWRWKRDTLTSIHMPTEAARTIHKVTDIRVERVQEITPLDAICEGYPFGLPSAGNSDVYTDRMVVAWFRNLWDSIYAKPSPILQAKKIVAYKSYPWSEETRDPRTTINGKPHHCHPNPHVWVNVFERVV